MASMKPCDKCGAECYWEQAPGGKWQLMDSETEEPHWTSCTMRDRQRGQFNGVLKTKPVGPLKDLSTMAIIGKLEERVKKLEDKVYGSR